MSLFNNSEIKFGAKISLLIFVIILAKLNPEETLKNFSDSAMELSYMQEIEEITNTDLIFKYIHLK